MSEDFRTGDDRTGHVAAAARPADDPGARDDRSFVPSRAAQTVADGLREHVDRSPLAIALVEGATHHLQYANPAFRRLGEARDEARDRTARGVTGSDTGTDGCEASLLGRALADVLPHVADELAALLGRVHASGAPETDVEITHTPADPAGEPRHWSVTVWPVPRDSGHPDHLMVQIRDVTEVAEERRRREALHDELRAVNAQLVLSSLREEDLRAQAQEASTAKSQFLATMSHELRTPLAAIIGYQSLLADGITGPVTEAQRVQLGRIRASASHLLALIDEVLTLARVEAEREVVRRETVPLADVVEGALTLLAPLAAAKGLALTVASADDGDTNTPTLETDGLKVRQILVNLIGNAVKYTDRGSVVLTLRTSGDAVVFEVRDTGIGIPPEHLERVFDTFWQVHQSTTRTAGGAGLGLSVSRRLARLLGGDITVASLVGRGSTFTFWLPRDGPPPAGAGSETEAVRAGPVG